MDAKKITIELELAPEIAFLVATHLASTAHGDLTLQKLLSKSGINSLHEVAQMMIDQVASKTDFDNMRMRTTLNFLKNKNDRPQDDLDYLFN